MIRGVLLDLSGVLYVGSEPVPGAHQALQRLSGSGLPVRYITNTTRKTSSTILRQLAAMRFAVTAAELFTAPLAAKDYLRRHRLVPYLLIHPNLKPEFAELEQRAAVNAVLVGDAGDGFTYAGMNEAFRLIRDGAALLALGTNRYFKDGDQFSLDAGPFVRALEYATEQQAVIIGKPAVDFYLSAVSSLGCRPEETIMVGDDVEADVVGAVHAGLQGMLVQTGKYSPGDEDKLVAHASCSADLAGAVEEILSKR